MLGKRRKSKRTARVEHEAITHHVGVNRKQGVDQQIFREDGCGIPAFRLSLFEKIHRGENDYGKQG